MSQIKRNFLERQWLQPGFQDEVDQLSTSYGSNSRRCYNCGFGKPSYELSG